MSIPFTLDRSLPVPLHVQLRGLIEYGIACGQLARGERLPSVRELAATLCIAPMTVSAVYRDLAEAQLIATRPGAGTFVADPPQDAAPPDALRRFDTLLDRVLAEADRHGIGRDALLARLSARAIRRTRPLRLLFVGVFAEASARYADAIRANLAPADSIDAETIERLRADEAVLHRARTADLALTIANRRGEVSALLGPGVPLLSVSFVPSEATRTALAGLDPRDRVAVVSLFPEFLAIMKPGVQRHAPHVSAITATLLDAPDLAAVIAASDAVVFATGAEAVLRQIPPGLRAIEYFHTPDPRDIEREVIPRLAALRLTPPHSNVQMLENVA
jgi:DNA-binding transcriptional regulator YhcF (GntR family)